jgi:uncharacterized membrane protein
MTRVYWIVALALVVGVWVVTALIYPGLPAKIPTHWNLQGKVDGYGSKGTLFIMPATIVGMLILFGLLPALSPKSFEVDASRSTYLFIVVLVLGMFTYMQGVIVYAVTRHGHIDMVRAMLSGLFLFLGLMGNVLGRVRRNFYIGVRVPWTLASERVWNDTHRVAAWVLVAASLAGFVMTVTGLPMIAAFGALIVGAVVPIVYSFVHYKALERRGAL